MSGQVARGVRVFVWMLGIVWVLLAACAVELAAPAVALAYVDPSVMTYTIQALAGVAVAIGAVAGVMWRRIRRKVLELLNVDEDHGKVREGSVHRTNATHDAARAAVTSGGAATAVAGDNERRGESCADGDSSQSGPSCKRKRGRTFRPLSYPKRFGFMIVAWAFVMYTYFVSGPYEIVGGNAESLVFTLRDVWLVMLVFAFVTGSIIAALLSLLRGRAYHIALGASFALALAGFLQALFMNDGLPAADGHAVPWGDFAGTMVVNALLWVVIIAAVVFLIVRFPALSRVCMVVLAFACMAAQTIGIAHYLIIDIAEGYTEPTVTKEGLFEVASENNVIVLLVDTADTQVFENMLQQYPDVMDDFTGFTYFKDSVGCAIPTSEAVPFLLSGERLGDNETYDEYEETRYTRSTFINDISAAGYSIGLYADCMFSGKSIFADKTMNLRTTPPMAVSVPGTIGILSQVTFYRDAPWVLKPLFWYYTDDINQAVVGDGDASPDSETPYILNDVHYYQELQQRGLTISDEEGATGAFRLIHLNGAHVPYVYDENMEVVEGGSTMERQLRGVFSILQEYVADLKELGVYDDATIIITADHGYWESTTDDLDRPTSPLTLVKPSTSAGGSDAAYATSTVPVSQEDFHPTVIDAVGGDKSGYGAGLTYFEIPDTPRTRTFISMKCDDFSPTTLWEYAVDGYALDFANWHLTGRSWAHNNTN